MQNAFAPGQEILLSVEVQGISPGKSGIKTAKRIVMSRHYMLPARTLYVMNNSDKQLKALFLDALEDVYETEKRIAGLLPTLVKAASRSDVRAALENSLHEALAHGNRLELVFKYVAGSPTGKKCEAAVGLANEAIQIATDFAGSPAINAALIAVIQKIEHYKIATYGCLHEWAVLLEFREAAKILDDCLNEEKDADEALTELARSGRNEEAALGETPTI